MRLICPNCATQYEVDANAIPVGGRDVQCGSCDQSWFQPPEGVQLPPELQRSGLAYEAEATPELPGDVPDIDTAPNEDIISEPDLEELIGEINVDVAEPPAVPEPSEPPETDANPQVTIEPEPAFVTPPEPVPAPENDPEISYEFDSETVDTVAPEPAVIEEIPIPKFVEPAAEIAPEPIDVPNPNVEPQVEELAPTFEDEMLDEQPSPEDIADLEAIDAPLMDPVEADLAVEPMNSVETSQVSEALYDEARLNAEHGAEDIANLERLDATPPPDQTEIETDVADHLTETVEIEEIETLPEPEPEPETLAQVIEAAGDDLEAGVEDLTEDGRAIPENPVEERLADYDEVAQIAAETEAEPDLRQLAQDVSSAEVPEDISEQIDDAAALEDDIGDGYSVDELRNQVRDAMDTAIGDQSSRLVSGQFDDVPGSDPTDDVGSAETLAAKLKARVAEAAQAQTSNSRSAVGSGALLAASAAGAAANQRITEFPKRDTEELNSSLRPKSLARSGLRPGLRPAATPEPTQSRFSTGFLMAIGIFLLLILLYIFRAQIASAIPPLASPLAAYGQTVDTIRLILQDAIGKLLG